jgi:hypothetical protein
MLMSGPDDIAEGLEILTETERGKIIYAIMIVRCIFVGAWSQIGNLRI